MTFIGQFADIRVGTQASLIGEKKCSIGNNSRLFINNHWSLAIIQILLPIVPFSLVSLDYLVA
jgi:hypothetical protein